jgi:hypothetical protein
MGFYSNGDIFGIHIYNFHNDMSNTLFSKISTKPMTYKEINDTYLFYTNLNDKNNIHFDILTSCISTLDYNIYSVLFKNKKIMINTIIINNIKNDAWRDLFLSLPPYTKEIEHIDMNKYTHCTRFQSTFKDIALFFIYLNNTYPNITIPKHISYQLNNLNFINSFPFSDNIIAKEPIFPWIISIISKSEYYIHPYLNNIIIVRN